MDATEPQGTGGRELTLLLTVMCAALALVVGSTSSLSIALPDLARDLRASQVELTWIVNVYSLTFAAVLLPFGIAADRYGRQRFLLAGLAVFGLASGASAFMVDPALVAGFRGLAGLGAAAVFPATLSVLIDAFPPERRARAVAVWAGVTGGAATLGTFIGGGMLEIAGWGSIQLVFGALALLLTPAVWRFVADSRNPALALDPVAGLIAVVGLGALVYGIIQAGETSLTNLPALMGLIVGVLGIAAFVLWELRSDAPMLDVRLFGEPGLAAGSLLLLLQFLAAFGFFFLAPQYLQTVQGYSAIGTACAFLPLTLGVGIVTPWVPRLMSSLGARWVGTIGMLCVATAFGALAVVTPEGGFLVFGAALVLVGAGFGLSLTPGTTLIVNGLPADRRTLASAVNDLTREVGGAIGGAVLGAVLIAVYQSRLDAALTGLPSGLADRAAGGIAEASAVARQLGMAGTDLLQAAESAYIDGFRVALLIAAGCSLAAAAACALLAPSGATAIEDPVSVAAGSATSSARTLPATPPRRAADSTA